MKILVTTGNGKVGEEVVRQLIAKKVAVRVGAHTVEKAKQKFPGAEVVKFDFHDEASQKAALQGVDTVYLAAPGDFPAEPEKKLIDLAKNAGVKRIVKLSVMGIEHAEQSPIRQVEKHLEQSGLQYTLVRPTWFMQNFATMHAQSLQQGTLAEPAAGGKTAFVDTRDIAAVAVKALTEDGHDKQAYALTGPQSLSREDVVKKIGAATGKPVKYVALSDAQFREGVKPFLPAHYVDLLSGLYELIRAGATDVVTGDVKKVLGREPISFDQFAKDHRGVWA